MKWIVCLTAGPTADVYGAPGAENGKIKLIPGRDELYPVMKLND